MAAATTLMAGAGAAIGMAGGISKMISGGKRKRESKRAIRQFNRNRQKLTNVNDGRRISTRGAEIALDEQARLAATSLDVLASGGIRGAVGGVGAVNSANRKVVNQVGTNLDQQQVLLDREKAQDEARVRQMKESRELQEQQLLYGQLNAAEQDQASGLGDIAGSAFGAGNIMANADMASAYGNQGVDQTPYVSQYNTSSGGYTPVNGIEMGQFDLPPVFTGK